MWPLRGQSLRGALQVNAGVERIMGTPPQMNGRNPSEFWGTLWVSCGVLCLIPSCLVAAAYYAHLLGDRQFWSGADFLSLLAFSVPLYGSMVGGPLAVVLAGVGHRSSRDTRWSRVAQVGGTLSLAWGVLFAVLAGDLAARLTGSMAVVLSLAVLVTATSRARQKGVGAVA